MRAILAPGLVAWGLSLAAMAAPGPAAAQELGVVRTSVLIIESDRLYNESAFGRRVAQELEAQSAVLAAENRKLQAEFEAEERDLTERRPTMEPEAFRTLANAFDEKAQNSRREQERKLRNLQQKQEASRAMFFAAAQPVLETMMREAGASVILERNTVALFASASDVTDLAIMRLDTTLGSGPAQLPELDGQ